MLLRVRRTKTSCAMTLVRTHMTGLWLHGAARVSWALTGKMLPLLMLQFIGISLCVVQMILF